MQTCSTKTNLHNHAKYEGFFYENALLADRRCYSITGGGGTNDAIFLINDTYWFGKHFSLTHTHTDTSTLFCFSLEFK